MKYLGLIIGVISICGIVWLAIRLSSRATSNTTPLRGQISPNSALVNSNQNASATVIATEDGWSVASVTIQSGDVVTFINQSDESVWPASNPHPSHTGLVGFDSRRPLGQGESYQFSFTKTGSFGFHDHLNPSQMGTITVQ